MKKPSEVFKSIRFAKGEPRDKPHKSTDNEEHYAVGEKEWNQQLQHVKKMAMMEETPPIKVRSLYTQTYAKHGGTASKAKEAQSKAYAEVEKKHGKQMRDSLEAFHKKNMNEENLEEGRPSQRHPLEGHEYHKKTNAELEYIAKDAHKAAEAMKSHNTTAENKYRDQANDSATVRYFRQKSGMPDWYKKKYGHMKETVKDKFDIGEYDQEGDMAKSDLRSILANAKRVHDMLEDDDNLPEWVQSKITKAEDYISTVANYMEAEMKEEVEQIDETKRMSAAVKLQRAFERAKEQRERSERAVKELLKPKQPTQPVQKEEVEQIDEKNVPTSPEKWAQAKAQAKQKFDVYPSAYANGWAAKKYKEMGGGWKSVSESREPPFEVPYKKVTGTVTDKSGAKHSPMSRVRDLARLAMRKQSEKMKKPIKEEEISRKAQIVKSVIKKKKDSADSFQKDPIISKSEVKM